MAKRCNHKPNKWWIIVRKHGLQKCSSNKKTRRKYLQQQNMCRRATAKTWCETSKMWLKWWKICSTMQACHRNRKERICHSVSNKTARNRRQVRQFREIRHCGWCGGSAIMQQTNKKSTKSTNWKLMHPREPRQSDNLTSKAEEFACPTPWMQRNCISARSDACQTANQAKMSKISKWANTWRRKEKWNHTLVNCDWPMIVSHANSRRTERCESMASSAISRCETNSAWFQ